MLPRLSTAELDYRTHVDHSGIVMHFKLLFALITGTVIGAAGVHVSEALEPPPAYLVVEYEITDPVGWREYLTGMSSVPGNRTFLARHAEGISLSGEPPKWIGILKYPNLRDALSYDSSPEYAALKPVRDKSTKWRAYVVEGVDASK